MWQDRVRLWASSWLWRLLVVSLSVSLPISAQCFDATGVSIVPLLVPIGAEPVDDEGETPDIPFVGFSFPLGLANYSHFTVNSNGELYLTDGTGTVGRASYGISSLAELRGAAGDSPRICALGGDNQGVAGLASWDIRVDDSVPLEVTVSWLGMRAYGAGCAFAMQVRLQASGSIEFSYSGDFRAQDLADYVGVSAGNAVGTGLEASVDLDGHAVGGGGGGGGGIGDTGNLLLVYQNSWPAFDLDQKTVRFEPNGSHGLRYGLLCAFGVTVARHRPYGAGCYELSTFASAYQAFSHWAHARHVLVGNAVRLSPDGLGGLWLRRVTAAIRPVASATPLALGDDDFALVQPTVPFLLLGTQPIADLFVCSNGFVALGAMTSSFQGLSVAGLTTAAVPLLVAFGADLDPSAAGSGSFFVEEHAGVLYVTADGVARYGAGGSGGPARQSHQYQFDLQSGVVTMIYGPMDEHAPGPVLVGYAPGSQSPGSLGLDMGGLDLASDLPFRISVDFEHPPLRLSASPPAVSGPVQGTAVSYAMTNLPATIADPLGGIGLVAIGFAALVPGPDLAPLGLPGCALHLQAVAQLLADPGQHGGSQQVVVLQVPPGLPAGSRFYAQAVATIAPGSPAGGSNALGLLLSNGVETIVSRFD